jgi:hypothetical protein
MLRCYYCYCYQAFLFATASLASSLGHYPADYFQIHAPPDHVDVVGDGTLVVVGLHAPATRTIGVAVPCYVQSCNHMAPDTDMLTTMAFRCLSPTATEAPHFSEVIEFPLVPSVVLTCRVDVFLLSLDGNNNDDEVVVPSKDAVTRFVAAVHVVDSDVFRNAMAAFIEAQASGQVVSRTVRVVPASQCHTKQDRADPTEKEKEVPPRLFYMFSFNREFRLLNLLLEELPPDVVDRFVLIEANMTHSGAQKPLHFASLGRSSTFRAFGVRGRILHVPILDMTQDMSDAERERYQRDQGVRLGLERLSARPNDMVVITDVDGIVRGDVLRQIKQCENLLGRRSSDENVVAGYSFWLRHHVYNLNWQMTSNSGMWGAQEGPRLVRASTLMGQDLTDRRATTSWHEDHNATAVFRSPKLAAPMLSFHVIFDAGWHLSWFGHNATTIMRKMSDSMDQELNIFKNVELVGLTVDYVLGMTARMIHRGDTFWGERLQWIASPNVPRGIRSSLAMHAMLGSRGGNDNDGQLLSDLDYWFARSTQAPLSTTVHHNATFVREQDQLWLTRLLMSNGGNSRHGNLCYVFGNSNVCSEQKQLNVQYRCGSAHYNNSIGILCKQYQLERAVCENIRIALEETCHGVAPGMEKKQSIYLNDDVETTVSIDGRPYLFHAPRDRVEEAAAIFCKQLNMQREDCTTLVDSIL